MGELIGYKKFFRNMLKLKEPEDKTKENEIQIEGVNFKWNVKDQVWVCIDSIGYKPVKTIPVYCIKCKCMKEHFINKDGNKIKCEKCSTITEIRI